ncbi:MAG: right-handed parallel beta-helix repeat-containing protein [Bacteroidales bacterium]|nr:right-handed parallel beta-helix repeat-containing protein [Bacteroidales bacterium]
MKKLLTVVLLLISFSLLSAQDEWSPVDSANHVIRVQSLQELLENLENNCTIELMPGMYNVSELDTNAYSKYFRWSFYLEGEDYAWEKSMLILQNMENVRIRGMGGKPEDVKIYSEDADAIVLILENCRNVQIENVWLGHITPSESCFGGVLSFVECDHIQLSNTSMYGTGYYGFEVYGASTVVCKNSEIWDCTGGAFHLYGCGKAFIDGCHFHDNTTRDYFSSLIGCGSVEIRNSIWENNVIENTAVDHQAIFSLHESHLVVSDSKFSGNYLESFIKRRESDTYSFENVDEQENTILEEYDAITVD